MGEHEENTRECSSEIHKSIYLRGDPEGWEGGMLEDVKDTSLVSDCDYAYDDEDRKG